MFTFGFCKGCMTTDSTIKIILSSNCFKKKKIIFIINNNDNGQNIDELFDKIKQVIEQHNSI